MVPDGDKSSSLVLASTVSIWTSLLSVMKVTLNGVVFAENEKGLTIEQSIHWNTLLRVQLLKTFFVFCNLRKSSLCRILHRVPTNTLSVKPNPIFQFLQV
jgi:hypothetical protein